MQLAKQVKVLQLNECGKCAVIDNFSDFHEFLTSLIDKDEFLIWAKDSIYINDYEDSYKSEADEVNNILHNFRLLWLYMEQINTTLYFML